VQGSRSEVRVTALFISYRRSDSLEPTQRLATVLEARFGEDVVFRDEDAIEAGADFSRVILDAVRAVLVVIGPHWLDARSTDGRPRLEAPDDFVRLEIETAFAWRAPVIPILVGGARMPSADSLPASIRKLAERNARPLGEDALLEDAEELARHLEKTLGVEPIPKDTNAYLGGRLQALRRYPFHLANLLRRPKRFLASKALGRQRDGVDALLFLFVSTVIAVWLAIAEWPGHSWDLFVGGVSVGVAATLVLSAPLSLAWRIVGAKGAYGRVLTVSAYQLSVVHLALGVAAIVSFGSVNLTDPESLRNVRDAFASGGVGDEMDRAVEALLANPGLQGALAMHLVLGAALPLWLWLSWGATRRSLGLGRWRSALALALSVGFLGAPLVLLLRAAAP
jgi:hypothetical protein